MKMMYQLFNADLFKHKHFLVLESLQSDTKLNQGLVMAQYMMESMREDTGLYKKLSDFLRKDGTMSRVYNVVLKMSKY